jgi:proteasome lid subunit RPN8/RPN11
MKVIVAKPILSGFRRRALKRYPIEYIEAIWGKVKGNNIYIHVLLPVEHEATRNDLEVDATEIEYGERDSGLIRLGSIHSHPDSRECSPSETDWIGLRDTPELVMGICQIVRREYRRRTSIQFYGGNAPFEVEYR